VNPHDLWTLKGQVGAPIELPVILGSDGAGRAADGTEVLIYPRLPTPEFRILGDGVDGTFAPRVAVPAASLVPKPHNLSLAEAATIGTAWLTAWRMLFTKARLQPGERLLVQGASGGVSTAAVMLGRAAGAHVTVTSRREDALRAALELGAHEAVLSGERVPHRADVAVETVGEATWDHTLKSLGPFGRVVVAGATSGPQVTSDLLRVTVRELTVMGSMLGTIEELHALCRFVEHADLHPPIAQIFDGVDRVPDALRSLDAGGHIGKLVLTVGD
jgi:NADPH:quinone reductase-like Zn-dependent oxidoreductase